MHLFVFKRSAEFVIIPFSCCLFVERFDLFGCCIDEADRPADTGDASCIVDEYPDINLFAGFEAGAKHLVFGFVMSSPRGICRAFTFSCVLAVGNVEVGLAVDAFKEET